MRANLYAQRKQFPYRIGVASRLLKITDDPNLVSGRNCESFCRT